MKRLPKRADAAPLYGDPPVDGPALAQVHPDIEALRLSDPDTAAAWRRAVRETVGTAMAEARHLTAAGRDGWYLLEPA